MKFYILDVFAKDVYQGNQLAVFLPQVELDAATMQQMAAEINFSESVFIHNLDETREEADVRIFTPKMEVDFAGHPVIGAAYMIRELLGHAPGTFTLNLNVGPVDVSFGKDPDAPFWVTQPEPVFGETLPAQKAAMLIGLSVDTLVPDLPVQMVSTGLPHVIVPVRDLEALRVCSLDLDQYGELVERTGIRNILVYAPGGYELGQSCAVRMFAPALGIAEDPATGSGNGCLAAYLMRNVYPDQDALAFKVGQGYEVGRPSHLSLAASRTGSSYTVHLGGNVVCVASGDWREPDQ